MLHRVSFLLFCYFSSSTGIGTKSDDLQKDDVCPPVLDIIILFDTSGGNDSVYQQQKNWTIEIVRELPIHEDAVRVGLIQYSEDAKTEFDLSRYSERNDLIKNLDTLQVSQGDTKTGVALNKADEEIFNYAGGARLKANRMIILFTDGLSMDNPTKSAKTLRRKGVKIFSISVNSIGFVPEMLGIVGDADNVFGPMDEDRLKERLLAEVEHSRSCEIQPKSQKKNEKTTSAFKSRTTEFFTSTLPTATDSLSLKSSTAVVLLEEPSSVLVSDSEKPLQSVENSNTSELKQLKPENQIEDIGIDASTSVPEVSSAWSEPIQLFTLESGHSTEVQHLTNLTNLLAEEPVVNVENSSANLSATTSTTIIQSEKSEVLEDTTITTISTLTTSAPGTTTICITQPVQTSTAISTSTPSQFSSTESFLTKLGVKKEKDPISKFLGRDVPNITLDKEKDFGKENENGIENSSGSNSSDDIEKLNNLEKSSKFAKVGTENSSGDADADDADSKGTTKFVFATRVTFRPNSTSSSKSPTTETAPLATSTRIPLTTLTTTTSPVTSRVSSVNSTSTSLSPSTTASSTRRFTSTSIQSSTSSILSTLASVTAFPTLLSMEKAVTLPLNSGSAHSKDGNGKPMKKKIRRIIKRRRNILPAGQVKKVTEKVVEVVKPSPTPTTPPVRSTLRPEIVEEKHEEIALPGVQCPMDILFVVDSSGSIARTYDTQKDFLTVLIKKVEPSRSHRVGLIQFAGPHIQKMEWSFDTHSKNSQLLSAIRSVRHLTGTTYIGAALELSLILLDSRRKHTETTVILISDGFSQDDSTQQAKLLRQLPNVKMYAISLNKLTNTRYLTDIVGDRKNLFVNDESKWFEEFFTKKLRCIPTRR